MTFRKKLTICLISVTFISMCSACANRQSPSTKQTTATKIVDTGLNKADVKDDSFKFEYEDLTGNLNTYTNNRFKFTMQYPYDWNVKIENTVTPPPSRSQDLNPDEGIWVYFNNSKDNRIEDEWMYVYGQDGHIGLTTDAMKEFSFSTKSGLKGKLYKQEMDGVSDIYFTLDDSKGSVGFYGAHIHMSAESYKKYEKSIMGVLRSIKLK